MQDFSEAGFHLGFASLGKSFGVFIPCKPSFERHYLKSKLLLTGAVLGAAFLIPGAPSQAASPNFIGQAVATQGVDFLVHLPVRNSAELDQLIRSQSDEQSPLYHHFLTPAQFRTEFGAAPQTVAKAAAELTAHGLAITKVDSQLIHVHGTAVAVNQAFHTQLGVAREADGSTRLAARTPLEVSPVLTSLGATVAGLAYTIKPKPGFTRAATGPDNRYSTVGPYWFDDLKQAYEYPSYTVANGKGVTVATVGQSDFSSADAVAYFAHEKVGPKGLAPPPNIQHVLLPGAAPFDPTTGISDEADLDVQMVAGSAPGATVLGVAIGGPGEAFLQAYSYLDESNVADIVSTSYGECELYYTAAYNNGVDLTGILRSYHDIFRQGNSQGITFIFSSGDNSGTECLPVAYLGPGKGKAYAPLQHGAGIWVDDPNVTGVGGTNLLTTYKPGSLVSRYVSENEIGDRIGPIDFYGTGNVIVGALWGSGGGESSLFAKPAFQYKIPTGYKMRAVPDVAMHMGGCPFYGPSITVDCGNPKAPRDSADLAIIGGQLAGLIGTSASAPEFAGLLAVKEAVQHTRYGNANDDLYALAAKNTATQNPYFHQGIQAYNGVVKIAPGQRGYNTITGVGTPIAKNYVGLPFAEAAGLPQTSTNP